jgi:hypothetical protein
MYAISEPNDENICVIVILYLEQRPVHFREVVLDLNCF